MISHSRAGTSGNRAGNGADGGNVDVENHVLDQVGVVDVLMVKASWCSSREDPCPSSSCRPCESKSEFRSCDPGDNAAELTHGAMIGAAPAHRMVLVFMVT